MPTYSIQGPDGKTYSIEGPAGATRDQVIAEVTKQLSTSQASAPTLPPTDADSPFVGSLKAGAERLKGEAALLAGKVGLMDEAEATKYRAEKEKLAERTYVPTEKGWSEAPLTKIKELAGSSLPYTAAPLAIAGAAALAPEAAIGALGATLAGGATSALQFTGTNLARQMDENKQTLGDTSLLKAGAAAVPQAALEIVGFKYLPLVRNIFNKAGVELTEKAAEEVVKRGILASAGKYAANTGKIMGVEGATEAGQQFLERLQAGLTIADPAARQEYLESFVGGAVLGGAFAIPGQAIEKLVAKKPDKEPEEQTKAGKSFVEEQDADDEAVTQPPAEQLGLELPVEERAPQDTAATADYAESLIARFGDTPEVRAEIKRETESPYGDTMRGEGDFPLFAPREKEAVTPKKDYVALVNTIGKEAYSPDRDSPFFGDRTYAGTVMDVVEGREFNDADTTDPEVAEKLYNTLALSLDANGYSKYLQQIDPYTPPTRPEVTTEAPPAMPAKEDVQAEFQQASQKVNEAIANKDEAAYEKALEELRVAREKTQTIQPGFQAPLFAQQQGLDFNQEMPVAPEGQAAAPAAPKVGQQGLDFTQEQQGEYVAPEVKKPKFGFTTETSAAPLQQFLARFKPRSSSEAERKKQQDALATLQDQISEMYVDDSSEQQLSYAKGVIDSFFDKYAATEVPSRQAALDNINNLSAEDQNKVLKGYTRLPDLTTYEGVKKLSDAFQDHVAEAELAGLGITKASSAYKQADEAVRSLRKKPKAQYDEQEQAAYGYFSNYGLDLALRSAAFDIATNTPRNQLFRGQGKEFGLRLKDWLDNNAPESAKKFDKYLRAYNKEYQGFKAFQEIQTTKESEAETVADYVAAEAKPKRSGEVRRAAPLHPVVAQHIRNNDLQGALKVIAATSEGPFQRRLAARLAQLNLTATVGVDKVDVLAEDYTTQTRSLLGRILGMADVLMPDEFISDGDTSRDMGLEIWDDPKQSMQDRFKMAEAAVRTVKQAAANNEIESSALNDAIKDAEETIAGVLTSYTARGVYFPTSDAISIASKDGLSTYVIVHETMHAGTARVVDNPELYSSQQQAAVAELKHLFEIAKLRADGKYYYGLTNIHEFIAEAFTKREFQEFLKGIKYKQSNMSLWDKFVQYCLEMFGYDNVLSSTIANVNILFDAPDNGKTFATPGPLYAKRNAKMFESNSAERSEPFSILTDLVKNSKTFSDIKENLAEALTTMNTQTRKTWLGALTLRQMNEMLGSEFGTDAEGKFKYISKLPQISRYLRKIEQMGAERSKVLEMHTAIARKLDILQRKSKPTIEKLNEIIQFATVNEVDPAAGAPTPKDPNAPTKKEQSQIDAYPTAKLLWDNLGKMKDGTQAHKLYEEMRDFFSTRLKEFKEVAYEREFQRQLAEGTSQSKKAGVAVNEEDIRKSAVAAIDAKFSDKITPYFPLKRFGRFWVRVGSGDDKKYMQFEDAKAQTVYIKKERTKLETTLRRQGATDAQIKTALEGNKYINVGNSLPDLANDLFSSRKVFDEVKNIVDTGGKDITDVEELRKLMVDQLGELYTTTLPLQSIQRMFMHRQNISGASADLIRSFQHAAMHMAYQHARFKYAPALDMELSAAKSTVDALKKENVDEGAILQDYLDAINLKHKENVITPADSPRWLNVASNLNFLWFLTAPASAIVNMLAVPAIALPVMSGKFGTAKSAKALGRYAKLLPSGGWKSLDTKTFDVPSIRRSPKISDLQRKAYDSASAGLFEQSLAHDAANFSENPSLDYSGRWGRIMEIATFPFHKAERFNREITYMAAFDLAYEKNGGDFEAAVNEASDLTYKTMFDYATYNKPRIMQGDISKLLLAFKQYPQHFTYLLLRTGYEATQNVSKAEIENLRAEYGDKGEDAVKKYIEETNAMRAEARKSFMMMMGMTFLFAGAAGLPMWWLYEGMANAFNAVFGDDEVPYDVNNEFKNKMTEVFGGFVGDSISRGVIPQLTGLSLSDRMSTNLTDMWFRDVKKNQDEVDYAENMIISLLGPTVGIGMKIPEALKRFNDGNVERAAEALAPAAFKNVLAASRLAKEGALTMKGDTLIEDISGTEAFTQMLGFTPERLAQRQSANIEAKSYEENVKQRRQDLLNFLAMAIEREDEDGEAKVLAKIDKYNEANDWLPIKGSTIRASLKKRAKERAMAGELGGIRVNKNFRDIAEEQTRYAEDEDEE